MNHKKENLLLIFTRNPELGKCKTRLAATVGDTSALEIYKFLLTHTVKFTKNLEATKRVYYSEYIWENDIWDNTVYEKRLQEGRDLGIRMAKAFKTGFEEGFKKIIVIGSDMYDLSTQDLQEAYNALDTNDFVIGPAEDGGYYFLGMTVFTPSLFEQKEWGTATVYVDSLKNISAKKVKKFPIKNDVDLYEDVKDIAAFQPFLEHIKL